MAELFYFHTLYMHLILQQELIMMTMMMMFTFKIIQCFFSGIFESCCHGTGK